MELRPDFHPTKLWLQLHPHLAFITEPQSLQKTTHSILVDTVDDLGSDSVSQNAREHCRMLVGRAERRNLCSMARKIRQVYPPTVTLTSETGPRAGTILEEA